MVAVLRNSIGDGVKGRGIGDSRRIHLRDSRRICRHFLNEESISMKNSVVLRDSLVSSGSRA